MKIGQSVVSFMNSLGLIIFQLTATFVKILLRQNDSPLPAQRTVGDVEYWKSIHSILLSVFYPSVCLFVVMNGLAVVGNGGTRWFKDARSITDLWVRVRNVETILSRTNIGTD